MPSQIEYQKRYDELVALIDQTHKILEIIYRSPSKFSIELRRQLERHLEDYGRELRNVGERFFRGEVREGQRELAACGQIRTATDYLAEFANRFSQDMAWPKH